MQDEYYKKFYENAPIGFFTICRESGQFVRANTTMLVMLGISNDQLHDLSLYDLYCNQEQKMRLDNMLERNNLLKDVEFPAILPTGERRWFLINARFCEGKYCEGHPETCSRCEFENCPIRQETILTAEPCPGFKCIEGSVVDITYRKTMDELIQRTKQEDMIALRKIQKDVEQRILEFDSGSFLLPH